MSRGCGGDRPRGKGAFHMALTLYDMHTHTEASHDSTQAPAALCDAALQLGLAGVAFTDHGDCPVLTQRRECETIAASVASAAAMRRQYDGRLRVLCGLELGEACWVPDAAATLLGLAEYDVVLASIHGLIEDGTPAYYSQVNFDAAHYTDRQLQDYLRRYLYDMAQNAADSDYDVLAHLDCPLRYINDRYHRGATLAAHADMVDEILRIVIARGKTLEVNTSGFAAGTNRLLPGADILTRYRALGGRQVCLGSDAHKKEALAAGFAATAAMLQRLGFAGQTIYIRRQPCTLPWQA